MAMNIVHCKVSEEELDSDVKHRPIDGDAHCRNEDRLSKHYFLDANFSLESICLSLSVQEICHSVDNDEMMTYQQEQQTNTPSHR